MSNHRVGAYGVTFRVDTGLDLSDFSDVTLRVSASGGGDSWTKNLSASTLFIGNSTVYSSSEGLTFTSGQWCYGANATAEAFLSAQNYVLQVECSATSKYYISPARTFTIDA